MRRIWYHVWHLAVLLGVAAIVAFIVFTAVTAPKTPRQGAHFPPLSGQLVHGGTGGVNLFTPPPPAPAKPYWYAPCPDNGNPGVVTEGISAVLAGVTCDPRG